MANNTRSPILNKAAIESVCRGLRSGMFLGEAAALARLAPPTFRAWIKRGERERVRVHEHGEEPAREEAIYLELLEETEHAAAETEQGTVEEIRLGSTKDKAWWLSKRYPTRWGGKDEAALATDAAPDARLTVIVQPAPGVEAKTNGNGNGNGGDK